MRNQRGFIGGDEALNPLLERLAFLESRNSGLKGDLDDALFRTEIQTMALKEQLQSAQLEVSRHQEILDNLCRETLAAVQARDRAVEEAQKNAVSGEKLDNAIRDEAAARGALTSAQESVDRLSAELEAALRERSEAARVAEKALLEKEVALQVLATVRLQAEADRRARDDADERARKLSETLGQRDAERKEAQTSPAVAAPAAPQTPVDASPRPPGADETSAQAPATQGPAAASPQWSKILPTLRRPVATAFARLKQLPLALIPEGPRAMIRMAAVSLTQTSDMLKALEEFFAEPVSVFMPGRVEVAVEAVLAAWEAPFKQRRISFVRRIEKALPQVVMRDEAVRVAVFQILRNAYDALPLGGSVSVQVAHEAGGVKVRFTDSGKGFSSQTLATLFQPFAGARAGHLGLGLSLARKLLRDCGGEVDASNGPLKGAVVTLHLRVHVESVPMPTMP